MDLALLQEAREPPPNVRKLIADSPAIEVDPAPFESKIVEGQVEWRTAIVKLSKNVRSIEWIEAKPINSAKSRELVASRPGTITAALVTPAKGKPLIAASMYAQWERTHELATHNCKFSDHSAHQVVSDISKLVTSWDRHRVLAAGDLNILRGYGEKGDRYWAARYKTVFDRLEAMGLLCVGPSFPHGDRADPWPKELPRGSRNVPTFRPKNNPRMSTRQLDFVFASPELSESLTVKALNTPQAWGPSDHCRIEIELME